MNGYQSRLFVLNEDLLCYYTSREKMLKGQQRGCIRLRGAAIGSKTSERKYKSSRCSGIDGENNCDFTITVDGKIFHIRARDKIERDAWVRALERAIHDYSGYHKPHQEDPLVDLNKRVAQGEQQSQDLLEQVNMIMRVVISYGFRLGSWRRQTNTSI